MQEYLPAEGKLNLAKSAGGTCCSLPRPMCLCRDPWVLPVEAGARQAAIARKHNLAESAGGASDHLALVKAFNAWSAAKRVGQERGCCASHFLSSSTMMMINGMRGQLLAELQVVVITLALLIMAMAKKVSLLCVVLVTHSLAEACDSSSTMIMVNGMRGQLLAEL